MTEEAQKRTSQYATNWLAYLETIRILPLNSCGEASWETGEVTSSIRTGGSSSNVDTDRWVENARASRAAEDLPSEENMSVRSTAVFSNVDVDSARDERRR